MAEYMLVDSERHVVPLDGLDPVKNVSLTDAGLTPYHAIKQSLPKLGARTTVLVLGTGGLGHVGIQILRAITGARVIAVDVNDEKLELASEVGADETALSNENATGRIRELTGGLGAVAVFDFVGVQPTIEIAAASAAIEAEVTIVGIGGGSIPFVFGSLPFDAALRTPYRGSRGELDEVLELARRGQITGEIEEFSLADAPRAYEKLHAGSLRGRAVVVPD